MSPFDMEPAVFELNKIVILDQTAIDEIRNAVIAWYDCEEGAPAIHPSSPMIELKDDGYMDALITFYRASDALLGKHTFPNPLLALPPYDRRSHGIPPVYFDGDTLRENIEIDITWDHLKLLMHMRACDWTPPERPSFDPKRVFNDHRDAVDGAYVALNKDAKADENGDFGLSAVEAARYRKLYLETAPALQVIVRHAKVEPGIYLDSFFDGFKRLGGCEDYDKLREWYSELKEDPEARLSRKRYIEMASRGAQSNRSRT